MAAKKKRSKKKAAREAPRLWVPKLGMFLLRVFTGALFVDAVYYKLWVTRMSANGMGLFEAFEHFVEADYKPLVQHAAANPPEIFGLELTWFSGFMEHAMLPGAVPTVMGPAVLIFELLLGIALILGTGVRLMAALGALLMLVFAMAKGSYMLSIAGSPPHGLGTNWILLFVLLALALTAAGADVGARQPPAAPPAGLGLLTEPAASRPLRAGRKVGRMGAAHARRGEAPPCCPSINRWSRTRSTTASPRRRSGSSARSR